MRIHKTGRSQLCWRAQQHEIKKDEATPRAKMQTLDVSLLSPQIKLRLNLPRATTENDSLWVGREQAENLVSVTRRTSGLRSHREPGMRAPPCEMSCSVGAEWVEVPPGGVAGHEKNFY